VRASLWIDLNGTCLKRPHCNYRGLTICITFTLRSLNSHRSIIRIALRFPFCRFVIMAAPTQRRSKPSEIRQLLLSDDTFMICDQCAKTRANSFWMPVDEDLVGYDFTSNYNTFRLALFGLTVLLMSAIYNSYTVNVNMPRNWYNFFKTDEHRRCFAFL